MVIALKVWEILKKPIVRQIQLVLGELAIGLSLSWLGLFALELIRPGIVSLYLDLNLILVLALGTWVLSILGKKPS